MQVRINAYITAAVQSYVQCTDGIRVCRIWVSIAHCPWIHHELTWNVNGYPSDCPTIPAGVIQAYRTGLAPQMYLLFPCHLPYYCKVQFLSD